MNVSLARVTAADRRALEHFFVAFFYDLSEFDDQIVLNEYGLPLWEPLGLPGPTTAEECARVNWWIRDGCEVYLVRVDGTPAGFATVCRNTGHLPEGVDQLLLDFYIAPKYRRHGVGRQVAHTLFDLHRGTWALFVLARNERARRFWEQLLADYMARRYETLDDGTQYRFKR